MNILDVALAGRIAASGGGGGHTDNYNDLSNLPQINGETLAGNKTAENLGLQDALTFDSTPTEDSTNPVESGGVYSELAKKQDNLTFDGTYDASTNKAATESTVTNAINELDVSATSFDADETISSISETDGKVSVTKQDIAIASNQVVAMTGYAKPSSAPANPAIQANDTANQAIGKLEFKADTNQTNIWYVLGKTGKNLINIADVTTTEEGFVIDVTYINPLPAGSYVFSYTSNQEYAGDAQFKARIGITELATPVITSKSGKNIIPFTISSTADNISLYSLRAGTYSDFMLCTEEDWNVSPDHQPYRGLPNYDLTVREAEDRAALAEQVDDGAKNIFDIFTALEVKAETITRTINADGTVTVSNSGTNIYTATLTYRISLVANTQYVISGCPSGGSDNTYSLSIRTTSSQPISDAIDYGSGSGVFTVPTSGEYVVYLRVAPNYAFSDKIFKPMVCTQAKWKISQNYTEHALPNTDLTRLQAEDRSSILSIENRLNNIHYAPVYGFRIKKGTESDPTAMVEYLYDAVGMTPASMNFTTGEFDYGSWGDLWFVKNNKPVALNFNGTEAFELSPTDWWKKADGTTDSGLENESSNYNFMARIPLVYVNRWEDANYNYVAISEQPVNTGFLAQAHTGLNGTINSNIYLPMFKGYIDSCTTAGTINTAGKLRSIGGAWISAGTTAEEEIRAANNIAGANSGWQLVAHSQRCLIQDLLTLISKSADAKGKFGYGDISTYNASDSTVHNGSVTGHPNNGKLKSAYEQDNTTKAACAQFKGYNDSVHHVTVFFMQDSWGNRWDITPGLNRINRAYKTKMIPPYTSNGNSDSTYLTASIQTPSAEGWLKTISSTNQFGNLPEAVGAAETTFFKSYFYTNSNTDEKLALVGGSCSNDAWCSPRFVNLNTAGSDRVWNVGGSPCFVSP